MIKIKNIRKIISMSIILLLCITPTFVISAKTSNKTLQKINTPNIEDCYVIKDVPYIGQETGIDCGICSFSMLVHYLEKNYGLHDLFYLTGSGHALGYDSGTIIKKIIPGLRPPMISPGSLECIWRDDWEYISNILGVKCNIEYTINIVDEEENWDEYWTRVKTYITNDTPVYTHIDMSVLTYNKKYNDYPVGSGICHAIVVVGYNETNGTVCINDPGPAYDGRPEEGRYFFTRTLVILKSLLKNQLNQVILSTLMAI